jgi:hypothetical protein
VVDLGELLHDLHQQAAFEPAADRACLWLMRRLEQEIAERRQTEPRAWSQATAGGASLFLAGPLGIVGTRRDAGAGSSRPRLSQSLWRRIQQTRLGVSATLAPCNLAVMTLDGQVVEPEDGEIPDISESFRSMRGADTHLLAWPLLDSEGAADGFLTLELVSHPHGPMFIGTSPAFARDLNRFSAVVPQLLRRMPVGEAALVDLPPWAGATMRQVLSRLAACSQIDGNLLISGPPGTGKSRLALWVHQRSSVKAGPFVVVDPLEVPPSEFERLLLGPNRDGGRVAAARGGTLVLDDILLATPEAQAAVLRLLDELAEERLAGANRLVRVIACTSTPLDAEVVGGRFSRELLNRLRFLEVEVPPLSRRVDEIPMWVKLFAREMHARVEMGGEATVAPSAMDELVRRRWQTGLRGLRRDLVAGYSLALAQRGPGAEGVVIAAEHLPEAEERQDQAAPTALGEVLRVSAELMANLAAARWAAGQPLDLDDADVLRGLLVEVAVQRWGPPEAIRRLGRGHMIASGNGAKLVTRELSRLETLREKLGLG